MSKLESGTELLFTQALILLTEIVIKKMEKGLRAPGRGESLPGKFNEYEKEQLEALLK